ncbi:MAG: hypothetical protein IJQ82_02490, partial [Selenomonadaceae bacterium]|nr:hypothetical protein [Selenomonadaceae bacterium]
MDNFVVCSSEFTYSESDSVLYWCQPNTGNYKRLANFEVVIKRRYALVSYYGMVERLALVLRGRNVRELEISLSEMSLLMQRIEKSFPEYRLYPDSRQQGVLFRQYVSEVYEKTAVTLPVDLVYQESGWHLTPLNVPHYYSGNDTVNCLSSFRLANQLNFTPQELVEWAIGVLSIGPMEVMLPLLIHAHLGYTLKLYEDAGYNEQYILSLIGASGSKKTSLARVLFCLFGEVMVNFMSTDRAIELDLMKRQDSTLLLDDLSSGSDKFLAGKFEKILRQLGDSIGRKRSINGGMEQDVVKTRCAVLLTAETDIDALSKSSKLRTLAVNIGVNTLDSAALYRYQQDEIIAHSAGQWSKLEQYMTLYVQFLEGNYSQIVQNLAIARSEPVSREFSFSRQATIFKMMSSQAKLMTDFWRIYFPVADAEVFAMYSDFVSVLMYLIGQNELRGQKVEPYVLFLQAIKYGLSCEPIVAQDKSSFVIGNFIGFWSGLNLMLRSDLSFDYVLKYYGRQGQMFPESLQGVLNKFYELGLLEVYEQKDHKAKLMKTVKIGNVNQNFICLRWH